MKIPLLIIALNLIALSCSQFNNRNKEPLARVHDSYLYKEDIIHLFNQNMNRDDSAQIARNYIDKWIRDQLFLRMAETNLSKADQNIDKKIAEFRASLLIYNYQQIMLSEKLDSAITLNEITEYFQDYGSNFVLDRPAIRGVYMKIPSGTPGIDRLTTWLRNENNLFEIESFAAENAADFSLFDDRWVYLKEIVQFLPPGSVNSNINLANTNYITASDDEFTYYIGIFGYLNPRTHMPIELASEKIERIILNKRKMQFLNELENNILKEALSKNSYHNYTKSN